MSNYTKTTDFEAKDSLPTGDSGKIIRGAEFETEFDAISTAIATKADTAGPTFTGTLTFETISDGTIGVTAFVDEDDMSSDSATLVPTQQSVKAYVDSQVTAQDLDFQADTGGALSIDLDSESLTFTGGTGIDTSGLGNAVTFAIDSTVATLTGTQTLTNKTLTSPDINTPDIDGGTIDGTVIGGTTAAAGSFTTVSATGNITVGGTVDGRDVATDGTKLDGIESGATADQTAAEIRTLVESATDSNVFTDADHTKLDGIEAGADVTDTANVTAAGALMDSEVTNLAQVKAFDSADYATAAQGTTADSAMQDLVDDTTPQLGGDLESNGNDILFADNDKAIFGAGSDLTIEHNGSFSRIQENGTGPLYIQATDLLLTDSTGVDTYATFAANGAATLRYDNTQRLATTSTGIDVTGTVTADSVVSSGHITAGSAYSLLFGDGGERISGNNSSSILTFVTDTAERMRISSAGNVGIGETTPDAVLHVTKTEATTGETEIARFERFTTGDNAYLRILADNANNLIKYDSTGSQSGAHVFLTGNSEKMRIDSSGNVGIGGSPSGQKFEVIESSGDATMRLRVTDGASNQSFFFYGNHTGPTQNIYFGDSSNTAAAGIRYLHSSDAMLFTGKGNGSEMARFDSAGNVKIGTNTDRFSYLTATTANLQIDGGVVFEPGVGNNVELFNYRSTDMLFGNGGAEDMRLDSSGNLLVGKTSASSAVHGGEIRATGQFVASVDGSWAGLFNRETDDGEIVRFKKDDTTVGSIATGGGSLDVYSSGASNVGLRFAQAVIPMLNGAVNDGNVDLGTNTRRFKDLYLSGGAYIGGTASANHLDDYEEGTWTPTYVGTTTNPSVTYDVQNGYYTKVGRKVTCHFAIRTTAITTQGVGVLQVAGLPFSCANVANIYGTGSLAFGYNFAANNGPITGYVNINSNKFTLVKSDSDDPRDGISAGVDAGSLGTSGAGNYLAMTFTYITA